MSFYRRVLAGAALTSSLLLADRVIDPFEKYEQDYRLEGPRQHSEVFYVSSNWYDNHGKKHDDRVGDSFIVIGSLSILGVGFSIIRQAEVEASKVIDA